MAAQPRSFTPRGWLLQIHLWSALIAGAIISALGLSGSVILFRQEIYRTANADLMRVAPKADRASLENQAQRVLEANPGARIAFIALPDDPRTATRFSLELQGAQPSRDKEVFVNPYTAEILGSNARTVRWLDWLADLHKNFFAGRIGREAHGYVAVFFLTLCLTGVVLWWPGQKLWHRNITPKKNLRGWRRAFVLHKVTGIWAALFLCMFALSAISLSCNISGFIYWATRSVPQQKRLLPETQWTPGQAFLPLDHYVSTAAQVFPGGQPLFVSFPTEKNRTIRVALRLSTDFRSQAALNSVFIDPRTSTVLRIDRFQAAPLGQRVLTNLSALHFGEFGFASDLPTRIVWSVLGLTPSFLFGTGLLSWRKGLRKGISTGQSKGSDGLSQNSLESEEKV